MGIKILSLFLVMKVCVCFTGGRRSVKPVASWTFTEVSNGTDLSEGAENPVTMNNVWYGPGVNGEPNGAVILPREFFQSMIVMNPTEKLRFTAGMTFYTKVRLKGGRQFLSGYNTGTKYKGYVGLSIPYTLSPHNEYKWIDVAIVYTKTRLKVYTNGQRDFAERVSTDVANGTRYGNIHIGRSPEVEYNSTTQGRMACVKLYNKPLRQHQVKDLTCDTPPLFVSPNPVASWTFTSENGGQDLSPFAENNITLTNIHYDIGPNGEQNGSAMFPQSFNQSMVVINPSHKLRFSKTMTYFTRLYVEDIKVIGAALFVYSTGLTSISDEVGSSLWLSNDYKRLETEYTGIDVEVEKIFNTRSWNDLAVVWDTSSISFYANGTLFRSFSGVSNFGLTKNRNLHLFSRPLWWYENWIELQSGRIACAKFFDVALTAMQVKMLKCDGDTEPVYEPVASWTFTSTNGGQDLSKYGENPATLTNVEYGPGPNGEQDSAVVLPMRNDQSIIIRNTTDKLRFSPAMTYFTHVYINGTTSGALFDYIYNNHSGSSLWVGLCSRPLSDPFWKTSLHVEKTGFHDTFRDVLTPQAWHKIAIVWDELTMDVYLNGEFISREYNWLNLFPNTVGDIHIGYIPELDQCKLAGRMACTKFFDEALPFHEVITLECDDTVDGF